MAYMKDSTGRRLDGFKAIGAVEADARFARNVPRRRDVPTPVLANITADTVMASPPTIGAIASTSAITNGKAWKAGLDGVIGAGAVDVNQPFNYAGVKKTSWRQEGSTFPGYGYMVFDVPDHTNAPSALYRQQFYFDGSKLEWKFHQFIGYNITIRVDGQRVSAAPVRTMSNSPAEALLPITFSSRKIRLIEIQSSLPFGRVITEPSDTVWVAEPAGFPRVVVLGDSYTQGTGSDYPGSTGYVQQLAARMGWVDLVTAAVGGSGYLNGGQAGKTFQQRVQADVIDLAPDVVLIVGGHNDTTSSSSNFTPAAFATAADLLYKTLRTALPNAVLIAVGPLGHQSEQGPYATMLASMVTKGAGVLDAVIDTMTVPWFFGTGNTVSPTGNGNDDFYFSSADIAHPVQAGHDYLARRLFAALVPVLVR